VQQEDKEREGGREIEGAIEGGRERWRYEDDS